MAIALKLISIREASDKTGYNPDYLSSLIRDKKLDGHRVGRNWFTTDVALKRYLRSRQFTGVKEYFYGSKLAKTVLVIFGIGMLAIIIWGLVHGVEVKRQRVPGDFNPTQTISTKAVNNMQITSFADEGGEVGISVKGVETPTKKTKK